MGAHSTGTAESATARESRDRPRRGVDRRTRHPLLSDWRWAFRGRRRTLRRSGDRCSSACVIDHYDASLLTVALGLFLVSAMDAAFTLTLIERGNASEANPLMDAMLTRGVEWFVGFKLLMTGVGVIALVTFSNLTIFQRYKLADVIRWVFYAYLGVIGYEMFLLRLSVPA